MRSLSDWSNRIRLASGLVLFTFLATHLLNHSLGLIGLDALSAGRRVFLFVWRNPVGTALLYAAIAAHIALALTACLRRRTFRQISVTEVAQILLGLLIPPLAVYHVLSTEGLHIAFGLNDTYAYVVLSLWHYEPLIGLIQAVLVLVAWAHGCIGVYFWLRLKPGYKRAEPYLFAGALILPLLALCGFASAGRAAVAMLQDPIWVAGFRASLTGLSPAAAAWVIAWRNLAYELMIGTLALLLLAWFALRWWEHTMVRVAIRYPEGRRVLVRPGTTVLEASRAAGIPHASVCGGRGRCSTCRVRVGAGGDALPPPSANEAQVLARIGAPASVRLACQIRPHHDLAVLPLLPASAGPREGYRRPEHLAGAEQEIAILFADLRGFTKMAENRLPYDVVFVLNQYFRAMGQAVEKSGGQLDKFIGDGVMALFGLGEDGGDGCRRALEAVPAMVAALGTLSASLSHVLSEPLRIGIGLHVGTVIVGEMGYGRANSVTAIGDAVNIASRLEELTKEFGVELVVSARVAERAGRDLGHFPRREIELRGRSQALPVYLVASSLSLAAEAAAQDSAQDAALTPRA